MLLVALFFLLALLVLVFVWTGREGMRFMPRRLDDKPIDAVITWVDGSRIREQIRRFGAYDHGRFDSNDEIRFCLRALEKNCFFIRRVFLVVHDDAHRPAFLREKHYQLTVVPHSAIIPAKNLPTFNSMAIENYLHLIDGLSEYFIYFNDDMIVTERLDPYFFFTADMLPIQTRDAEHRVKTTNAVFWKKGPGGRPVVRDGDVFERDFRLKDVVRQNNELLDVMFGAAERWRAAHVPYACRKSFHLSLDDALRAVDGGAGRSVYEETGAARFRSLRTIARYSFFKKYWDMRVYGCPEETRQVIALDITEDRCPVDSMSTGRYPTIVLHNRVLSDTGSVRSCFRRVHDALGRLFPEPSTFEK
jgi:hypothetical protein